MVLISSIICKQTILKFVPKVLINSVYCYGTKTNRHSSPLRKKISSLILVESVQTSLIDETTLWIDSTAEEA